jgi:hypothetical protein
MASGAGMASGRVGTEVVDGVVGAGRGNGLDRQMRPLGKLGREQPADQRAVGVLFVEVHLRWAHRCLPARTPPRSLGSERGITHERPP